MSSSNHLKRVESKRNDYLEEKIVIESTDDTFPRDATITISFDSVLHDNTNNEVDNSKLIVKDAKSVMDRFLLSILEEFQLDSLSISMSDSSDQTFSIDSEDSDDSTAHLHSFNFPVGTAVRYQPRLISHSTTNTNKEDYEYISVNEFGLLRALTTNGLLCSNVPVQGITEYIENQYTPYHEPSHTSKNNYTTSQSNKIDNGAKMIILSEYAYTLCHTNTAYTSMTQAHPCRDKEGILSRFSHERLNDISMKHKTMWLQVQRVHPTTDEVISGKEEFGNLVSIRRGLRYTKSLEFIATEGNENNNSVTLRMLLGAEDKDEEGVEEDYYASNLYPCPLMDSSQVITRIHSSSSTQPITTKHDLYSESLGMDMVLYTFGSENWKSMLMKTHGFDSVVSSHQDKTNERESAKVLGIERTVDRSRGVSNTGTFQTRLYHQGVYDAPKDYQQECTISGDTCHIDQLNRNHQHSLNVTIVDLYPRVVKLRLHSLRAILMQGGGAGNEHFFHDPSSVNANQTKVTHLSLWDLPSHKLQLSSEGSAVLSITTSIPPDSSLYIMMDYQPQFLTFQQFPMDPNRGITVPPSYATIHNPYLLHNTKSANDTINTCQMSKEAIDAMSLMLDSIHVPCPDTPFLIYSNALMILPPVPDMTMPFNVIALSTSLYALLLGTTINLLLRKASQSVSDSYKGLKRKTPMQKLKAKLLQVKNKIRHKQGVKNKEEKPLLKKESEGKENEED